MKLFNSHFRIKEGIYCISCAEHAEKIIKHDFGTSKIKINLVDKTLEITSHRKISPESIKKSLKTKGRIIIEQLSN